MSVIVRLDEGQRRSMAASTSARTVCPIQRMRSSRTLSMPGTRVTAAVA
jgi:hypothetical protein